MSKQNCNACENFLCSNGKMYCTEHNIELHGTFDAWGEPQNTCCEMFVEKEKEVETADCRRQTAADASVKETTDRRQQTQAFPQSLIPSPHSSQIPSP